MDGVTGLIYMLTCRISQRSYIGQTMRSFKKRLSEYKSCKHQHGIHRAIRKHGLDNFDKIILHDNVPFKDLNVLEKHCIWIYNTMAPNGYNLEDGGKNKILSEELKAKISENQPKKFGKENPKYRQDVRDQKDIIIQKYQNGISPNVLCKEFDCAATLIIDILKENNIETRKPKNIIQYTKDIIEEYANGMSTVDLGKKYNCSASCIGNILKKNGIELGKYRGRNKHNK